MGSGSIFLQIDSRNGYVIPENDARPLPNRNLKTENLPMSQQLFEQLNHLQDTSGAESAIHELIETLRKEKNYDRLFEAMLLKHRYEMKLPLAQPTSLEVPEDQRKEFEDHYIETAREVGELFLADGNLPRAWPYLRTIGEGEKVKQALEELCLDREADDETERYIAIALHEGAHPVKGLELMLKTYGICNTITTFDQALQQQILSPDDQKRAAAMLVNEIYEDLKQTLEHEVTRKIAAVPPGSTLRELIADRNWLFGDNNYHIDVSHLNAVVRFARAFDRDMPELQKVIELCEYGSKLSSQFQYGGDPPFDEFYPAHLHFFKVLAGENVEEHLQYFRDRLEAEPDEDDKPYLAIVLVDLLIRLDRLSEAVDAATPYLCRVNDLSPHGFSYVRLCQDAGRYDAWKAACRESEDAVGYAAAVIQESQHSGK